MFRLFYVSTAASPYDSSMVDALAAKAAEKNARLGVTGALAWNGINFAQVLEGDRDTVDRLLDEIRADKRHSGLIVVSAKAADSRRWDGWSMRRIEGLDFQPLIDSLAD